MCSKAQHIEVKEEYEFKQLLDEIYSPAEGSAFEYRLREVLQFCERNGEYLLQNRRYMEFCGLLTLLNPLSFSLYYSLLNTMLEFSKKTNDVNSMTEICKNLELTYNRINVLIVENVINTLLELKSYGNAGELCLYLNEWQNINNNISKKEHLNSPRDQR